MRRNKNDAVVFYRGTKSIIARGDICEWKPLKWRRGRPRNLYLIVKVVQVCDVFCKVKVRVLEELQYKYGAWFPEIRHAYIDHLTETDLEEIHDLISPMNRLVSK